MISTGPLRMGSLVQLILIVSVLMSFERVYAAEFFCSSGNVTCLIAYINEANTLPGQHIINLEPGKYTLQAIDNAENGLPVIMGALQIKAVNDDLPTVIERDAEALFFRIFSVAARAELTLHGITVQGGGGGFLHDSSIFNAGTTSLFNSVVRDSNGEGGAIGNNGTLNVIKSMILDNVVGHEGGGIRNGIVGAVSGNVLVENSTIAGNGSRGGSGGIGNFGGTVRVRNSSIIFNGTDGVQPGGGIGNYAGATFEIINSTIAKNRGGGGGGGILNRGAGFVSIINSTIRENVASSAFGQGGGGILNEGGPSGGTVQIKNTLVVGNRLEDSGSSFFGPDCAGVITTLGSNLLGDTTNCDINLRADDLIGDPGLGSLVEIGEDDQPGKVFYPVLPGSVVINRGDPNTCPTKDQLGNPRVGSCDIGAIEFQERTQVAIDIRPRSDANRVNPNSAKSINVAILSEKGFEAITVDPKLIRFGSNGTGVAPVNVAHRDVNRDGQRDLVLRFQIQDLGIECGATSLSLTGQLLDGRPIIGSAPITTSGCKAKKK